MIVGAHPKPQQITAAVLVGNLFCQFAYGLGMAGADVDGTTHSSQRKRGNLFTSSGNIKIISYLRATRQLCRFAGSTTQIRHQRRHLRLRHRGKSLAQANAIFAVARVRTKPEKGSLGFRIWCGGA